MKPKIPKSFWKNSTSGAAFPTPLREKDIERMAEARMKAWTPVVGACSPRAWKAYLEYKSTPTKPEERGK